jgi:GTPase SAR1 family protein
MNKKINIDNNRINLNIWDTAGNIYKKIANPETFKFSIGLRLC